MINLAILNPDLKHIGPDIQRPPAGTQQIWKGKNMCTHTHTHLHRHFTFINVLLNVALLQIKCLIKSYHGSHMWSSQVVLVVKNLTAICRRLKTHTHTYIRMYIQFSSVHFSRSVVSDSLWPHESQHARPPCPSPTIYIYIYICMYMVLNASQIETIKGLACSGKKRNSVREWTYTEIWVLQHILICFQIPFKMYYLQMPYLLHILRELTLKIEE